MYNKIMAPLDGSELGECSLSHVEEIALGCKSKEVVLFGVMEPFAMGSASAIMAAMGDDFTKKAEQNAKTWLTDYLNKIADNLKKKGVIVSTVVAEGYAAEEIMEYAKNKAVDLIVMSSHGRSGIGKFAFGSVTDKVLRHSTVPVLIVTAKSCRS